MQSPRLHFVEVSFGTILKGVAPVFTFAWGLLLGVERWSWRVFASLWVIAAGIALASLGEGREFQPAGFCLQVGASALGGWRWAMTHRLLKRGAARTSACGDDDDEEDGVGGDDEGADADEAAKPLSPLNAILYTSPMTSLCVLPFALFLEGAKIFESQHHVNASPTNSTQLALSATEPESTTPVRVNEVTVVLCAMTLIATLVFILLLSEYWLVKVTSSLALSVAGVFKELLTIAGGIFFFGETLDGLNVFGFTPCQVGILSYIALRTKRRTNASYDQVGEVPRQENR